MPENLLVRLKAVLWVVQLALELASWWVLVLVYVLVLNLALLKL